MNEISNRVKSSSKPKETSEAILKNPTEKQNSRLKDLSNLDLSHRNAENEESSNSKKINTLMAEVDRLSQENRELSTLLHEERMRSGEVQRKAKNSGKIKTIVDRNLQNELKHEKEEAVRLRHLLNQIENERSDLLNKIKDLELVVSSFSYEKKELVTSFHEKNELIQLLEKENRKLVQTLSDMNEEFKLKEKEVKDLEDDRKRLCSSLIIVENQKADAETKFNHEKEKVLIVCTEKKQEIENIKFVHNKHSKVLAGLNLLLRLKLVIQNLFACNFKSIQTFSELSLKKSAKVNKFFLIPLKCFNRRMKNSWDTWRAVLNWKSLSNTCRGFVHLHHQKSFISKHFSGWRKLFIYKKQEKILKFSSCDKIFKILLQISKKLEKKSIQVWSKNNHLIKKAENVIFDLFLNFCHRKEKFTFFNWKKKSQEILKSQAFDDLACDFAAVLLKHKYLKGLRQVTRIKRIKREFRERQNYQADLWHGKKVLLDLKNFTETWNRKLKITQKINRIVYKKDSAKAIGKWKLSVKSCKISKRLNQIFKLKIKEIQKKDSEKCFFVWKEFLKNTKYLKCLNELNYEKPLRLKLQQQVQEINGISQIKEKSSAFKVFSKVLVKKLVDCLKKWKVSVANHRKSIALMVKFIKVMRLGKAKSAVVRWKEVVSNMRIFQLNKSLNGKIQENRMIVEHIENLEKVLEGTNSCIDQIKKQNLKRVLIKISNFFMLTAFRVWGKKAFIISNKKSSAVFIEQTLKKTIFRLSFLKIFQFSLKTSKRRKNQKIILKISELLLKNSKLLTFTAFKTFTFFNQSLRKSCKKFLSKKSLALKKAFIQKWQQVKNDIKKTITSQEFSLILQEKQKIFTELETTCKNFELEQETSKFYLKSLKKRSSLRILNFFNDFTKTSLCHYFSLWKQKLQVSFKKSSKLVKIVQVLQRNQTKRSFIKWLHFLKVDAQEKAQKEIKKQIHEKKVNIRAHREVQGKLEADVQTKEIKIKQLDTILIKELRIKEFLLNRCVKHFHQEYSENRAAFAFKLIKNRFLLIKSASWQLAKRVKHAQKRFAFQAIVETVKHLIFVNNLYEKLYSTFHKFSKMYEKRLFEMWKVNIYEVEIIRKVKKIAQSNEELRKISTKSRKEKEKYMKNTLGLLEKDKKRRILKSWFIVAKKCKSIEGAFLEFEQKTKEKKFRKTLKKFSKFRKNQADKKEKLEATNLFFYQKTLYKVFNHLKHRKNVIITMLTKAISRNSNKNTKNLSKAFQKLHKNSLTRRIQSLSVKNSRKSSLNRLIFHIFSKTLENSFKSWKSFLQVKLRTQTLLKRSLLRGLHRKYSKALQKWQENYLIKDTTDKVNRSGLVAIENSLLREKSEILELLLKTEGIDRRYIERFIQERESLNLSLKRRGVSMLKYRAGLTNSKDTRIQPKFFITWRLWTVKRKRIKKISTRLCLYRHKASLIQGFNTWKRSIRYSSSQPRHLLLSEISKLRLSLKFQQTELQSCKSDLVYMKAYSSILEGHTKRGQNLTLVLLRQNVLKSYFQSFLRWVVHCNLCKVHDLLTSLTGTEEKLYMTQSQLKSLGHDYYVLEQDNLELRQASLDGVAIADAFETLSKEREKLTNDLAERTATIKKLLEHNNLLTFRLRQFESDEKGQEMARFKRY